jgi:hypothetical protein
LDGIICTVGGGIVGVGAVLEPPYKRIETRTNNWFANMRIRSIGSTGDDGFRDHISLFFLNDNNLSVVSLGRKYLHRRW